MAAEPVRPNGQRVLETTFHALQKLAREGKWLSA